jgi:hypothetical protein
MPRGPNAAGFGPLQAPPPPVACRRSWLAGKTAPLVSSRGHPLVSGSSASTRKLRTAGVKSWGGEGAAPSNASWNDSGKLRSACESAGRRAAPGCQVQEGRRGRLWGGGSESVGLVDCCVARSSAVLPMQPTPASSCSSPPPPATRRSSGCASTPPVVPAAAPGLPCKLRAARCSGPSTEP